MRKKLLLFAVALLSVATLGVVQLTANAKIDVSPDCDKYAIIWCGAANTKEFNDRFNSDDHNKDHAKVYAAFGINKADVTGMVEGVVWKNGNVTVGNSTVVATNARQAARHLGGTPIAGTNASITSTSVFADEGQAAMIKMVNGQFKFAIIKSCGNPVSAKPKPKPPVPAAECVSLTKTPISRTQARFTAAPAKVSGGAKVIAYNYYFGDNTKQTTTATSVTHNFTTPKTYTITLTVTVQLGNSKKDITKDTCKTTFTVTPPPVVSAYSCDKLTVSKINRTNVKFDTAYTLKNAALKSIWYVIRDEKGKEIGRTDKSTYEVKTEGKYTAEAYVTVIVNKQTKTTALNDKCKKPFEIEKLPETPAAKCEGLTVDKIEGVELDRTFTGGASVSGGAAILGYLIDFDLADNTEAPMPIASTAETVTANHTYAKPGTYTAQLSVKVKINNQEKTITDDKCKVQIKVTPKVCEAPDGNTYPEGDERCAPCPVPGKEHLPKGAECYDCTTPGHENDAKCVETPPELPKTGTADGVMAFVGVGSLIAAVGYYVASRRALIG